MKLVNTQIVKFGKDNHHDMLTIGEPLPFDRISLHFRPINKLKEDVSIIIHFMPLNPSTPIESIINIPRQSKGGEFILKKSAVDVIQIIQLMANVWEDAEFEIRVFDKG